MELPAAVVATPDDSIQVIRRFNRFYTRQIGVLEEHLLQSQFSLTELRVLYEIAHRENATAKDLCRDLGLDRGYVSRMLQSFDHNGWIHTTPSVDDRRRQFLSLTAQGHKVFDPLERRSSEEVAAMLSRLSPNQQRKLLAAQFTTSNHLWLRNNRRQRPTWSASTVPETLGWVVQRQGELYWREYHYDRTF